MRTLLSSLIFAGLMAVTIIRCDKPPARLPPEEDLKISIDAASYTITPGPDFSFNLTVDSAVPIGGVKIEYTVKGEFDNQNYPQASPINTYSKVTKINIIGLPRQRICICTVTVTSKTNSANVATTSFRVGYK